MSVGERAKKALSHMETRWISQWDDAWELTIPTRVLTVKTTETGNTIHDSTAGQSMRRLANVILAGITPPWTKWFSLIPGTLVKDEDRQGLSIRLQSINDIIYSEINLSNFTQAIQQTFLDGVMSTGAILIEPDDLGGLRFKNIPLGTFAIKENAQGKVKNFYHKRELSGQDLIDLFQVEKVEPEKEYEIIVAVEETNEEITRTVILETNNRTNQQILSTTTLDWNPYIVFRWNQVPGDVYGWGPGMELFYDNRFLNRIKELAAKGFALDIGGVYTALDDNVFNAYSVSLEPQSILTVTSNDRQNPTISRLDTSTNVNVAQFQIETLRSDIKKGFMEDRFSPPVGEKLTATEIVMRARLIAQELGAVYGVIEKELLRPVVLITLKILETQAKIPPGLIPNGQLVDVVYLSQLAQSQKLGEVDNVVKFTQFTQLFGQTDPKAALLLKGDDALRDIAENLDIDPKLLRSSGEINTIIKQAQEAQQKALEAQQGAQQPPQQPPQQ